MPKQSRGLVLAAVAVGAAAIALYFGFGRGSSQEIDVAPYNALGVVAAEETAKLLANQGQVLLLVPDTGPDKNPSVEAEIEAFQHTLKQWNGISLALDRVSVTPMLMMATGGGVPPDQLFRSLDAHPNARALVLFFRFPQLTEADLQRLNQKNLKVVVASSFYPDYQRLLERRALHLVIAPRLDPPEPGGPAPQTVRERFDQDYSIVRLP